MLEVGEMLGPMWVFASPDHVTVLSAMINEPEKEECPVCLHGRHTAGTSVTSRSRDGILLPVRPICSAGSSCELPNRRIGPEEVTEML